MTIQELPADDNSCGGLPLTNRSACPSHNDRPPARLALTHADLAELVARFGKLIKCICGTSPGYISGLPYTAICGAPATGWFAEEHLELIDSSLSSTGPHQNPLKPHSSIGMHANSQ
ncbi:hypothetical protein D9M68_422200 [compost metagenome]